jgi:hypothetical protein
VVFAPAFVAATESDIDKNVVGPLIAQKKETEYAAVPELQVKSFVPVVLKIDAGRH